MPTPKRTAHISVFHNYIRDCCALLALIWDQLGEESLTPDDELDWSDARSMRELRSGLINLLIPPSCRYLASEDRARASIEAAIRHKKV